jgi:hypothetical protein
MATIRLPRDFRDFLSLLSAHEVKYLLIGGYAVGFHGYPRATADMDIWVSRTDENAQKLVSVLEEFGFRDAASARQALTQAGQVIRMGVPPLRIELVTSISGVDFDACHAERSESVIDDVRVSILSLADLKRNKKAAGRLKDLADLEELP